MKVSRIIALASVLTVLTVLGTGAVFAKTTMSHGKHVNGSVTAVDQAKQTFDVKARSGKSTDLTWNAATKAPKEPLAAGEMVNVTYMVKDGKNVATVITLETPKAAKPAKKS
jgi:hypothetical protein